VNGFRPQWSGPDDIGNGSSHVLQEGHCPTTKGPFLDLLGGLWVCVLYLHFCSQSSSTPVTSPSLWVFSASHPGPGG
jgi:hypothetical protein